MSTRREFLSSIPVIWFPVIQAKAKQEDRVDELVGELSAALERLHGGKWAATQDDKKRYVLLARH